MTNLSSEIEQLKDEAESQWQVVQKTKAAYTAELHIWCQQTTKLRALLLQGAIEGNPECKELLESGRY